MHQIEPLGTGPYVDSLEDIERLIVGHWDVIKFLRDFHVPPGRVIINGQIQSVDGRGRVNAEFMGPYHAMLGNYLPAIAEAKGLNYTAQQKEHWKLLLTTLWSYLKEHDGQAMNTSPENLRKKLIRMAQGLPDADRIAFIHPDPNSSLEIRHLASDLSCFLDGVAFMARNEEKLHREEVRQRVKEKAREDAQRRKEEKEKRKALPWADRFKARFRSKRT